VVQLHDASTEHYDFRLEAFEGVIADGEYGAGKVIVWDRGWYANRSHDKAGKAIEVAAAIAAGQVGFDLHGRKLRGRYSLTRMRGRGPDGWLLVKSDDELGSARRQPAAARRSVKSGRRTEDLDRDSSR
jgi:hypothetical protein